ncbi:MAG: hypothetical protein GY898_20180 [Proteobacteria bacterium]|nr:hypothetical protein [Pseudomonadota bacterium]
MRHLLLALLLALPFVGCGPDDDDPFGRGGTPTDDDDGTEDVDPEDISGWVEFRRRSIESAENTVDVIAFAAYWQPLPVEFGAPVPQETDQCTSGTNQPDLFDLPQHENDVGDTIIELQDDEEVLLDEIDPELNRFFAEVGTESWEPEQEYTIRITGGADGEAASFDGALGTPEVMALTDAVTQVADGLLVRWFGQNSNGHVELRFVGEPLDVEGKDEGAVRWVACRLHDDGQHTIEYSNFDVFDGDVTLMTLTRKRSTDFEYAPNRIARAVGSSVVHNQYVFAELPGDDDDSGHHPDDDDDDDSAEHDDDDSAD